MQDLSSLYRKGLIPGPEEDKGAFSRRVELFEAGNSSSHFPVSAEDRKAAFSITRTIYGIAPNWIEVEMSDKGLRFWEAGAAWQLDDGTWKIQLHPQQRLAIRSEVLAHEAVHVARAAFKENRFEEILAFRTSAKGWRRFFGPLIQRPIEVWLVLMVILLDLIFTFKQMMPCATLLILGIGIIRLTWNQWHFSRCLSRLINPSLILCLTDQEIIAIAKGASFSELDDGSLRWQMINVCADAHSADSSHSGI